MHGGAIDWKSLAALELKVEYITRSGGQATITSKQKRSLVRGIWKLVDVESQLPSPLEVRAFEWLMANNTTYHDWVLHHRNLLAQATPHDTSWRHIPTAELLLHSPGLEVAARPWLYPHPAMADTDVGQRLAALGRLAPGSKPSLRPSFYRKLRSRCRAYGEDFVLEAYLHDVALARQISSVVAVAASKRLAPDQVASGMNNFEAYWHQQTQRLEDMCRQMGKFPTLFFTVAPAEWTFPLHHGIFDPQLPATDLSNHQALLTLHLHNCLSAVLEHALLRQGSELAACGVQSVEQYAYRFEFQSRGTLHVHVVAWATFLPGQDLQKLTGKSKGSSNSPFVRFLESTFRCGAVDVQCSASSHCLLRYVAGYVSKASDALQFTRREASGGAQAGEESRWAQVYRLLCKRSPLEQEMCLEFACLPLVKASFTGDDYFAPVPGSTALNHSRRAYNAFQQCLRDGHVSVRADQPSFIQWLRGWQVADVRKRPGEEGEDAEYVYKVKQRNIAGPGRGKCCAVGMTFAFELLDIYLGQWAATFLPGQREEGLVHPAPEAAPENCQHLSSVLALHDNNVQRLLEKIVPDLQWRGFGLRRILTFKARIHACGLLLAAVERKELNPAEWSARSFREAPRRLWPPQQQQVLDAVQAGTAVVDANAVRASNRLLQVSGGPGTGKTEVIIEAAITSAHNGCKVLLLGPIGLLVNSHRQRIPADLDITVETVHAAFKVTREADKQYIPPGRLRHFDLIIFDEVSQIDAMVWQQLQVAFRELTALPYVVFVGDFQQLQPVEGFHQLQRDLEEQAAAGAVQHIVLQQHAGARSAQPDMLAFLQHCRTRQPSRHTLGAFFGPRLWQRDLATAVAKARALEERAGKPFTFLTVANAGAAALNRAWVRQSFPAAAQQLEAGRGFPGDPSCGKEQENLVFCEGMQVRLTQNLDKDRGFVNGAVGIICRMLRQDVFVLRTAANVLLLVHPIWQKKHGQFMPVTYAYATTIRRAQGATLDLVGIFFDRKLADAGYGYVAVSRARLREEVFHIGPLRRTDWRPVGGDDRGLNQERLSVDSVSDEEGPESEGMAVDSSDEDVEVEDGPPEEEESEGPGLEEPEEEEERVLA